MMHSGGRQRLCLASTVTDTWVRGKLFSFAGFPFVAAVLCLYAELQGNEALAITISIENRFFEACANEPKRDYPPIR